MIFVLGMHRSGTSMLARILVDSGLDPGPVDDLIHEPTKPNPTGLYETYTFTAINMGIMACWDAKWDKPQMQDRRAYFQAVKMVRKHKRLRKHERARKILEAYDASVESARNYMLMLQMKTGVLKDPRACLTWPVWREAARRRAVVAVYRNPRDVCESLKRRDNMGEEKAVNVWRGYTQALVSALKARREPWVLVSYEDMLEGGEDRENLRAFIERHAGVAEINWRSAISDHRRARAAPDAWYKWCVPLEPDRKLYDELKGLAG